MNASAPAATATTAACKAIPLTGEEGQPNKEIRHIITKARVSWLRNTEVYHVLNCVTDLDLPVSTEAPHLPKPGQLYLFNRKHVRFFRRDGWNWKKKSDGKTVKEVHEKLKIGSKDALNCYYAHAEVGIQRRCYWLLEGNDSIVLVHYLDTTGTKMVQRGIYTQLLTQSLPNVSDAAQCSSAVMPRVTLSFSHAGERDLLRRSLHSSESAPEGGPLAPHGAGAFTITTGSSQVPSAAFFLPAHAATSCSRTRSQSLGPPSPAQDVPPHRSHGCSIAEQPQLQGLPKLPPDVALGPGRDSSGIGTGTGSGSGVVHSSSSATSLRPVFTVTTSVDERGKVLAVAEPPGVPQSAVRSSVQKEHPQQAARGPEGDGSAVWSADRATLLPFNGFGAPIMLSALATTGLLTAGPLGRAVNNDRFVFDNPYTSLAGIRSSAPLLFQSSGPRPAQVPVHLFGQTESAHSLRSAFAAPFTAAAATEMSCGGVRGDGHDSGRYSPIDAAIEEAARDLQALGARRAGALPSHMQSCSSNTPEITRALLVVAAAAATEDAGPRQDPDCPGRLLSAFSAPANREARLSAGSRGLQGYLPLHCQHKQTSAVGMRHAASERQFVSAFEKGSVGALAPCMEQRC